MLSLFAYFILIVAFLIALYIIYVFLSPRSYNFLSLKLEGNLMPERESTAPASLFKLHQSLPMLLEVIQAAEKEPKIKGIFLKIKNVESGWAKLEELREALANFKQKGKTAIVLLDQAGNKDYYLSTTADKILLAPAGGLNITGMRLEVLFFADALEKLGIYPDIHHIGKYKSTSEVFTRKEMSEPHRESLETILDIIYQRYIESIAHNRKMKPEEVRDLIDRAPFTAAEALQARLVDSALYGDQIPDYIKELLGAEPKFIEAKRYWKVISRRARIRGFFQSRPKVALIYATGTILPGINRSLPLLGPVMGDETIIKSIRMVRESKSIRAVVMRVESRGGSILASDNIWREVELTKKVKPFIISMGDLAASGGFYISLGASKILAQPGTITGSIGLVYGKLVLTKLYEKLGLKKEALSRGKNAGIFSDYDSISPDQKEKLLHQMESIYKKFLEKVSQGREIPMEEVEKIAQGRAWVGVQAQELKLLDRLGGLKDALNLAKEMANIPEAKEIALTIFPEKKGLFRRLLEALRHPGPFVNPARDLVELFPSSSSNLPGIRVSEFSEPFLALPPYLIEIK